MIDLDKHIEKYKDALENHTYYCAIIHGRTFSTWTNNGLRVFYARKGDLISAVARWARWKLSMSERANTTSKEIKDGLKERFEDEDNKDFRIVSVKL